MSGNNTLGYTHAFSLCSTLLPCSALALVTKSAGPINDCSCENNNFPSIITLFPLDCHTAVHASHQLYITFLQYLTQAATTLVLDHIIKEILTHVRLDPAAHDRQAAKPNAIMAPLPRRKKRDARLSHIYKQIDELMGDDQASTDRNDNVHNKASEMDARDEAEAFRRHEERRIAREEKWEMEHFRRQQARTRTKAETELIKDMHNYRLKRLQQLRAAYEAEYKISHPPKTIHEPAPEAERDFKQESINMEKGQSKTKVTSGPDLSMPAAGDQTLSTHKIWHDLPAIPAGQVLSSDPKRPSLWNIDFEAAPAVTRKQSPPLMTRWRYPERKRDKLNRDMSRIKTEFILSDEFVDDVNNMLEFIENMHWDTFWDMRLSFKKDINNRDRVVRFVEHGDREWGVNLQRPDSTNTDILYEDDEPEIGWLIDDGHLPQVCQDEGCDDGCPRKVSFEEKKAELRKFREHQSEKASSVS